MIVKRFPNGFVQTDLDDRLNALSARNLVLAGFMTHMCVNSTTRGASNLGYAATVVASATATRALPGTPENVSFAAVQAASLAPSGTSSASWSLTSPRSPTEFLRPQRAW